MYTWVTRTALLCTFVMPALASCAGDDDAVGQPAPCMPNLMSTMFVGGADDPCPQDYVDPATGMINCPSASFMAVSMCDATGKWQYPCTCIEKPPRCGDGKRTGQEQCEGADLGGMTCAKLVAPTSTGAPTCSPSCTLVMTSCTAGTPVPMGGAGG